MQLDADRLSALAEKCGYKVAEVAKLLGISDRHLERLFHRDFGKPPMKWLTKLRMKRALVLLAEYRHTKIVAIRLGYKSAASFINAFKKAHGMLPSTWLAALEDGPGTGGGHDTTAFSASSTV